MWLSYDDHMTVPSPSHVHHNTVLKTRGCVLKPVMWWSRDCHMKLHAVPSPSLIQNKDVLNMVMWQSCDCHMKLHAVPSPSLIQNKDVLNMVMWQSCDCHMKLHPVPAPSFIKMVVQLSWGHVPYPPPEGDVSVCTFFKLAWMCCVYLGRMRGAWAMSGSISTCEERKVSNWYHVRERVSQGVPNVWHRGGWTGLQLECQ